MHYCSEKDQEVAVMGLTGSDTTTINYHPDAIKISFILELLYQGQTSLASYQLYRYLTFQDVMITDLGTIHTKESLLRC